MIKFFLALTLSTLIFAQAATTQKIATICIDTSQLSEGYEVNYTLFGKIVSIEREPDGKPKVIDKDIISRQTHQLTVRGKSHFKPFHELNFDIDDTTLNGTMFLKIYLKYSIYDENGNHIRTSNIVLHSIEKNSTITIKSLAPTKDGKPNILVAVGNGDLSDSKKIKTIPK